MTDLLHHRDARISQLTSDDTTDGSSGPGGALPTPIPSAPAGPAPAAASAAPALVPAPPARQLDVTVLWGREGGLGKAWNPDIAPALVRNALPSPTEVEAIYRAASAEPPLSEGPEHAALFARVYDASVRTGQVITTFVREGRTLRSFAYGHHWTWAEQDYEWALELKERLGEVAPTIEGTFALNLLARDPNLRQAGLGRRTLEAWLGAIDGYGSWLQTDDLDTPARRLYTSLGFVELGHGPDAPNGQPGLVMFRPAS